MKKIVLVIVLMVLVRPLKLGYKYYLSSCPGDGPEMQDDFPMYLEKVDLNKYYEGILAYSERFEVKELERIEYEGDSLPIYEINIPSELVNKKLLIIAGMHGNEFAPIVGIFQLLGDIAGNQEHYNDWNIRIVTPANPVGLKYQSRYNGQGCDINRDFKDLKTMEARVVKQVVDEYKADIVITLHEGPQDGFFMYADGVNVDLEGKILKDLIDEEVDFESKSRFVLSLKTAGLARKGAFVYWVQNLIGMETMGWYANKNGFPLLTTESSWVNENMEMRTKPHLVVIKSVIENYEI